MVVFFRSRLPLRICSENSAAMSFTEMGFLPLSPPPAICAGITYVEMGAADALPSAKSATVCCTSDCRDASALRRSFPAGVRSIRISSSSSVGALPSSLAKMASTPNRSRPYRSRLSTPSNDSLCFVLPRDTICSRNSFFSARCCMRSSTVPAVTSR